MAELSIKITTKYEQAEKGFNRVTGSVKKYGDELIKARKEGTATRANVEDYVNALNKALVTEDRTKDGMAALTAQSKILGKEIAKMGLAFGDDAGLVKQLEGALKTVKNDMQSMPQATRKAAAGMKEVDKASGGASNKLLSVAKNILKFQLLMGPITAAIRGFKDTIRDSVNLAAEAEQRYSKLATVFDTMSKSAKGMAQSLAGSLGVANSTAASALSTVGDLLQAQGMGTAESLSTSAGWIQQFQDIIAFKDINMSLEEFAQNFMSGAAGNLRNFRTFGSIVKESAVNARLAAEGYDKLTGSQLELAKMTTRATIALEQQANAMGATEREWETMLAVNRRLDEAWKQYKENLGETINTALKPMKSWLADILSLTNKVTSNIKEIESGEFTVKVEQKTTDKYLDEIYETFLGVNGKGLASLSPFAKFIEEFITPGEMRGYASRDKSLAEQNSIESATVQQIVDLMKSTGATGSQVFSSLVLKNHGAFDNETATAIGTVIDAAERIVNAWKAEESALQNRKINIEKASDSYTGFAEALLGIKGVQFSPYNITSDVMAANANAGESATSSFINGLQTILFNNLDAAFESLTGSDLSKWGDVITGALDQLDEGGLRQSQIDSVRSYFEAVWNEFAKGGFSKEELAVLDEISAKYKDLNRELDEYNARLERQKNALSAYNSGLSSLSSSSASYGRQMELIGLSEFDTQVKELTFAFEDMKAQFSGFTSDELKELGIDLTKLDEEFGKQITAYTDLYNAQQAYAATLAAQSNVSGFVTGAQGRLAKNAFVEKYIGYGMNFANGERYEMNKAQAALWYDYTQNWRQINSNLATMTPNAAGQYDLGGGLLMTFAEIQQVMEDDLLLSFKDLADAVDEVTSEFWKQYNPFQGTVDAFNTGKEELGGISGGIWGVLLELVKNTEAFQTLMSLVQDTIVPIMDAVLKPLMPALESITTLFDMLPWEIITFGIKVISSTLVLILHPIKMIFAIVHNIFEWLKHPVNKGARDIISLNAIADETNALLDKIWKTTTDIERNTDKDNLALLRDLYSRGIINEDQFYAGARVVQKDMVFDPVQATNPSYIASNSPASRAISYGGFTFYITGNDPEETARATIRALREAGVDLPYNTAIGRA